MNQLLRLLWITTFRRAAAIDLYDTCSTPFMVVPADLDVLRHMNNGIYSSLMDLGRVDLMRRAGLLSKLNKLGWYPVATLVSIQFRKSLGLWQRFTIETRVLGVDDKSTYVEQRFVRRGQTMALAVVGARFLKKSGGSCTPEELVTLSGNTAPVPVLPAWVKALSGHYEAQRLAERALEAQA
jgi:acyl-CoA thioesterase FadM